MEQKLDNNAVLMLKQKKRRKFWTRVLSVMMCLVVFCTTYALILPAITMEADTYCGIEAHTHTEDCFEQVLTCQPHEHSDACYEEQNQLICALPESEGHTHSDGCCTTSVTCVCGEEESEEHTHTDACYTTAVVYDCGQEEAQPHTHSDECYEVSMEQTCALEADPDHQHTESCYEQHLICRLEEHEHMLSCYSDPSADLESVSSWEKTLPKKLSGVYAEDVLAVAESQLGYTESTRNYIVEESSEIKGYTRYGDWYGIPYGDWCATFVSFCLNYAGVENIPLDASCPHWISTLQSDELYESAADYIPIAGDIVFFDWDLDLSSDHVGIVTEYIPATEHNEAQIQTIEGNSGNCVRYVTYNLADPTIMGYGKLPEQPGVYTYIDDTIRVDVALPKDSEVPENAILSVEPIVDGDENYDTLMEQAEDAVKGTVNQVKFYDISFFTQNGEYIPVSDKAKVSLRFRQEDVNPNADLVVLHFEEEDTDPVALVGVQVEEQAVLADNEKVPAVEAVPETLAEADPDAAMDTVVTFETPGFSTFAVVELTAEYQTVQGITGLEGKSYIIAAVNNDTGKNADGTPNVLPVMTSVQIDGGNARLQKRLTDSFVYSDNKVTSVALTDYTNAVWTFEKAGTDTYYIKSSGEQYLSITNGNDSLTLSDDQQEFRVVAATGLNANNGDAMNAVCIETDINGTIYRVILAANSLAQDFTSYNHPIDNSQTHLVLVEYTEPKTPDLTDLAGKSYIIAGVNFEGDYKNDVLPVLTSNTDAENEKHLASRRTEKVVSKDNNVISVELSNYADAVWTFEDAGDGTYYIKNSEGQYLSIPEIAHLTVGDTQQKFSVVAATGANADGDATNAVCIQAENGYYVNIAGNYPYNVNNDSQGDFTGYNPEKGTGDRGNHLVLIEYTEHQIKMPVISVGADNNAVNNLDGKKLVITNINAVAITGKAFDADNDNNDDHLEEKQVTIANGQSTVTISSENSADLVWEFEAAKDQEGNTIDGQYYIKHVATGKYLNIYAYGDAGNKPLTLEETDNPQAIEVLSAKDNNNPNAVWFRFPELLYQGDEYDNNNNDYNAIDRYGGGFAVYNKSSAEEQNMFLLSEYTDLPMMDAFDPAVGVPLGDLNGKTMVITLPSFDAVLTNNATNGNTRLQAQEAKENNGVLSITSDTQMAEVKWTFTSASEFDPSQYYIQDSDGKYLNIDGQIVTLTSEVPSQPITVHDNGDGTVVLYVEQGDKKYSINLYNNSRNDGFGAWEVDLDNPGNNTKLKLTPIENFVGNVINLDGLITAIVAVDNTGGGYAAVSSTMDNNLLVSRPVTKEEDIFKSIDENNDLVWQFEAVPGQPGCYYIKVANVYGGEGEKNENGDPVPVNNNKGKYLIITADGLSLGGEGSVIEAVTAVDAAIENTICLRTKIDGKYYYLNLPQNTAGNNYSTWNSNTDDKGNHFVLTTLTDDIVTKILTLPRDSAELEAMVDPVGKDNEDYEDEMALRDEVLKIAKELWDEYYSKGETVELTALQKNFLGQKNIDKWQNLEEILTWLNRVPETVPATTVLGAKVQVFNYSSAIADSNPPGFSFFQGGHGYSGRHVHNGNDSCVDGPGDNYKLDPELQQMTATLGADGYPQYTYGDQTYTLADLFSNENGYLKSKDSDIMNNGGGLFRYDAESGYYYYYSDLNAAYYDENANQFILYDAIVRPEYQQLTEDKNYEPVSNFLPFNPIFDEDGNTNVIYDYDYETGEYATTGSYSNPSYQNGYGEDPNTMYLNEKIDLWFGMTMEMDFRQPRDGKVSNGEDMIFDFHGDDDVFVYIDGVLVLDIGAAHEAWDGKINFATGEVEYQHRTTNPETGETLSDGAKIETTLKKLFMEAAGYKVDEMSEEQYNAVTSVTIKLADGTEKEIKFEGNTFADYSSHKLNFFYMERGGNISYCGLKFNLVPLPEKSLAVSKAVTTTDDTAVNDQTYYTFRILQANDGNKDGKLSPFFGKDGKAMSFEIWENDEYTGNVGFVDPDTGMFSLKAGQTAKFIDVLDNAVDPTEDEYIVQEVIYNARTGQYVGVTLNGESVTGEEAPSDTTTNYLTENPELWGLQEGDMVYTSAPRPGDENAELAYVNTVNATSTLQITKEQTPGAELEGKEFQFAVLMGDERIVSAAAYELDPDPSISEYSATMLDLSPIPVGTEYTVTGTDINGSETKKVTEAGMITLKVGQTATFDGLVLGTNYEVYEIVPEKGGYVVDSYKVVDEEDNDIEGAAVTASGAAGEISATGQTVKVVVTNTTYEIALNLHISKQVIGFDKADTFTFDIEQGTFNFETGAWTNPVDRPNAVIPVTTGEITSGTAVLAFDSNDEGPYYFKITEQNTNGSYIYDTTVYLAEVKVSTEEAKVTELWKIIYNSDGTYLKLEPVAKVEVSEGIEEYPISFVNYGTYATVTKYVTEGNTDGTFNFTATVVYDSDIVYTWPESLDYTVGDTTTTSDGKKSTAITFDLKDTESVTFPIPANSNLKVSELNHEGYHTTYSVTFPDNANIQGVGPTADASVKSGTVSIVFVNKTGYELPKSGGTGTNSLYTMGGVLLTAACALLLYNHKKRRKEDFASS